MALNGKSAGRTLTSLPAAAADCASDFTQSESRSLATPDHHHGEGFSERSADLRLEAAPALERVVPPDGISLGLDDRRKLPCQVTVLRRVADEDVRHEVSSIYRATSSTKRMVRHVARDGPIQ